MSLIYKIINIFVLMIFAVTSVVQYHQHDCEGNIHIHLTTLEDLVFGLHSNSCGCHDNNLECNQSLPHGHGEGDCSMHIADYKASELSEIVGDSPIYILDLFIPSQIILLNRFKQNVFSTVESDLKIKPIKLASCLLLRAPPYLN